MTPEKNRPNAGQFAPGHSGNARGRPRGLPNKATVEVKAFSRGLIESPAYVASLKKRLIDGKAPHMETLLYQYAFGKPKEESPPPQWNLDPASLAKLSDEDLEKALAHADQVQRILAGADHR